MLGARDRSLAGHKSSLLFDQVCNCACNCTTILQLADGHGGDAGREEAARGGGKGNTRDDKREEVRSKYDEDDDADQHGKEK